MSLNNKLFINDKNIKITNLDNNLFNEFNEKNISKGIQLNYANNDELTDIFDTHDNNIKITFKNVDDYFLNTYWENSAETTNNSNIIEVIGIYIKGQKILYTEAKTSCEQKFTYLMLPSILFTILTGIINLFITSLEGKIITSSLNGLIAFILAVINFLKLDARAEAHRSSAYKFDKLLTYIQFQSGKQLFFIEEKEKMKEVIGYIETTLKEIKETNQFVLPETIRYNFPILSNINIFSEVKKISCKEMLLMNKLSNILNYMKKLEKDLKEKEKEDEKNDTKIDLELKIIEKDQLVNMILTIQNEYTNLDNQINEEIKKYSERNKYSFRLLDWLKV
jgi:hypothetical protein